MSATSVISNLNQALQCAGKCDYCNKLQEQINNLSQRLNNLDNKFVSKQDLTNLESKLNSKFATKQELSKLEQFVNQGFNAIKTLLYYLYDQLESKKLGYEYKEIFMDEVSRRISDAMNALRGRQGNGDPNLEQRVRDLENKNNNYVQKTAWNSGQTQDNQRINKVEGDLWGLQNKLNQFTTKQQAENTLLWGAIKALQAQVFALGKLFATIEILRQTVETLKRLIDLWKPYFHKDLSAEIARLEGQVNIAFNTALKAFNIASSAKSLADKALSEIDILREQALQAMLRLQGQIQELRKYVDSEIGFVTQKALDAMLRLQRRIESIESSISKFNAEVFRIGDIANTAINKANQAILEALKANQLATLAIGKISELSVQLQIKIDNLTKKISELSVQLQIKIDNLTKKISAQFEELKADTLKKINEIKKDLDAKIQKLKIDIPGIIAALLPGLLSLGLLYPLVVTIVNNITNRNMTIVNNNYNTTNVNNVNNTTVVQQSQPQDLSWLKQQLNRIETVGGINMGISLGIQSITNLINEKCGAQIFGKGGAKIGIGGKLVQGFNWLIIDRALNVLTFGVTIHNAAMLSGNIIQTLTQAMQNVVELVGIKDDNGDPIELFPLINSSITNAVKYVIGKENYEIFIKQWDSYNRIYQASANLFSSLLSMGDSITQGLQVIGGQTGKIGNALRAWGVVSDKAYGWFNPTPNFSNPLLTKLNSLEETASIVENVSQQPLSVKSAKEELEAASKELADSLEQKEGSKQGAEIPEAKKVKEEQDTIINESKGKDLTPPDLEPDEDE
jgi:hypothetical protein